MSVDRPTFSESWYRVSTLKPALRTVVQTYRQHYRARMWYVLRDPTNNQFFRLDDAGYHFVGMLDGKRTVAEVWDACNEELGDRAPTQGEAIQLLGQLFTSNLLSAELPPDSASMFERYRKRVRREVGGYFMNLLFMRIPLFDPEPILEKWVSVCGWAFSKIGLLLWCILLGFAFSQLTGRWDELFAAADPQLLLQTENILLLYLCFAGLKAIHEFGHGFACKRFGRLNGTGGEVHTMGIMFLVLMPVPYVDASSAWAFRSKWQRIIVGAGGMYIELAIAAIAAIVWANTNAGTLVHDICFNVMLIASVSTILFNANPLLRYDGYYMLSDLLEMPNLYQRSKDYLYYLVKRYVYRARKPRNPANTSGERGWLFFYAIAASIYRVFITVAITLYLMDLLQGVLLFVAIFLALSGLVSFMIMPMFKWFKYLATSDELARSRRLAIITTMLFLGTIITVIGFIPFPDRERAPAVIEPEKYHNLFMQADGIVTDTRESGTRVSKGDWLIKATNEELVAQQKEVVADLKLAAAQSRLARADNELGLVASYVDKQIALERQRVRLKEQIESLNIVSPIDGIWISPDIEQMRGTYLKTGDELGLVASEDALVIRAVTDQTLGPRLMPEVMAIAKNQERPAKVEIRVKGRPGDWFEGVIPSEKDIAPAGHDQLSSQSLGYHAGGSVQVRMDDQSGTKAAEPMFEVKIRPLHAERNAAMLAEWEAARAKAESLGKTPPPKPQPIVLRSGQRVEVRFEMPAKPLAVQWYLKIRQLLQRRFKM
ncbi:MAG: hypothetical protein WD768_08465 [Phycisphaeraceae bacterium]